MPKLLHEFWSDATGGSFGCVSAERDRERSRIWPQLRFDFEIWAVSWREAMRLYEERAYGEFGKSYDHFPDTVYTAEDEAVQRAYLAVRGDVR